MANKTGGFGLRAVMTVGSTPATGGQAEYKNLVLTVGIFQNNPVSQQHTAGDDGLLQDASFAGLMNRWNCWWSIGHNGQHSRHCVGVFNGIFYNSSTSKPTFSNHVLAGTTFGTDYNTGSSDGIGFVNDNPMQEYVVKADAAVTQANLRNF